jgi:hypothetical protein
VRRGGFATDLKGFAPASFRLDVAPPANP